MTAALLDAVARDAADAGCVVDELSQRITCAADYLRTEPPPRDAVIDGLVDIGDKMALFGKSKSKKTWLLLQLGACVAEGAPFVGFDIPKPRTVLFVNPEVRPAHMHRRTLLYAAGRECPGLARMHFFHTRGVGAGWADIAEAARRVEAEVVLVDSIYKFQSGEENEASAWKELCFQMDVLCESTGCMLAYSHHDTKGAVGEKDVVDRGSGSGVAGRDYDACIAIGRHAHVADGIVAEFVARNYPTPELRPLLWQNGRFDVAPDLGALVATSKTRMQAMSRAPALEASYPRVVEAVEGGPIPRGVLEERLRASTRMGGHRILTLVNNALHEGIISRTDRLKVRNGSVLYGLPEEVASLANRTNQKNEVPA